MDAHPLPHISFYAIDFLLAMEDGLVTTSIGHRTMARTLNSMLSFSQPSKILQSNVYYDWSGQSLVEIEQSATAYEPIAK